METIGEKISKIRKQKGLTQENLAEDAKVNLRTIQRIENNETEPRGTTLNLICKVLNINIEDILDYGKVEDKKYIVFFHLSVLAFLAIPLANIIIPLILWQTKKDKILSLTERAINLINFQIIWSGITCSSMVAFAFFKIMYPSAAIYFLYCFIGLCVINIIFPILFTYRTNKNNRNNYYPKIISLIK